MKHKYILLAVVPLLLSCSKGVATLEIASTRDFDTDHEIVAVDIADLPNALQQCDFVVYDAEGAEVAYQITHDHKLIFPASVKANATAVYRLAKGTPAPADTFATGRLYPERRDDMVWENDKIGFRAYGPASQRLGDRLYGYDIFLKRDTDWPILEGLIALNENPELCARIDSLRRAGRNDEAETLDRAKSYHIDHGHGMDCYAVGPTLGAATTALVDSGRIVYPWCFESQEVLDNGPLRFSVALTYPPVVVGNDTVTERRIITLDAGTHLNHTTVIYEGLSAPCEVVTGIVMHEGSDQLSCDAEKRYIAYADPTQSSDNGEIYIGAVFLQQPDKAQVARDGDISHVAAYNTLPETNTFSYLWGAAWNRSDIPTWTDWLTYLSHSATALTHPLIVKQF